MKKVKSITVRILMTALVPLVLMGFVNGYFGTVFVARALRSQCVETLRTMCISVDAAVNSIDDGEYSLDSKGNLLKGGYNITEHAEGLDNFVKDTDIDLSFFYGDTRKATTMLDTETNERIIDTQADQAIADQVLAGEIYSDVKSKVNDIDYYVYYYPMKNPDGKVVGMISAGEPCEAFEALILERKHNLITLSAIVLVLGMISTILVIVHITKAIVDTEKGIKALADGNLAYDLNPKLLKRGDEIGDMARSTSNTTEMLRDMLEKVRNISNNLLDSGKELESVSRQTSDNSNEIARAVEDIANGAANQAEEVENATKNVDNMGVVIEKVVQNIEKLNTVSAQMEEAGLEADRNIQDLTESNNKTVDAIHAVAKNVEETDASVGRISEAVKLIQSVAEQTNLLSLNASIEAARAGEAGKGFAVVASEIQKLAEEANGSAAKIAEIIEDLLENSQNSMDMMEDVKDKLNDQQTRFEGTKQCFRNVKDGILSSREGTADINTQAKECDKSRDEVTGVISNLSALSEENAAATEETTASMQELNATINTLAQSAENLKEMAVTLEEKIGYFKI